jgi:hypothetical protein
LRGVGSAVPDAQTAVSIWTHASHTELTFTERG